MSDSDGGYVSFIKSMYMILITYKNRNVQVAEKNKSYVIGAYKNGGKIYFIVQKIYKI